MIHIFDAIVAEVLDVDIETEYKEKILVTVINELGSELDSITESAYYEDTTFKRALETAMPGKYHNEE